MPLFSPAAAWLRAYLYFAACALFAHVTGALAALLNSSAVPAAGGLPWLISSAALLLFVAFAYGVLWSRWTLRFNRKLDVIPQLVFGLSWGVAYALSFLGFWHLALNLGHGWPMWGVFLLAYTLISLWQVLWQDLVWDIYVSPEHDTPWTTKVKVPCTHIPNITLSLVYFAYFDAYWGFVISQVVALTLCSIAMRMPAPWSKEATPAATRHPFVFGLSHGGGYVSADPANDPHLKAIGAPY